MGLFNKRAANTDNDSNGADLINEFLNKSEGLLRILEKETEYFRDMKMKQAEMLIETKLNLIQEIEELKASLIINTNALKMLPENEKKRIRLSNEILMNAAQDNYNETLKAKEVNKLILEAISEAVSTSKRIDGAYGEKGNANKSDSSASPIAIIHNA